MSWWCTKNQRIRLQRKSIVFHLWRCILNLVKRVQGWKRTSKLCCQLIFYYLTTKSILEQIARWLYLQINQILLVVFFFLKVQILISQQWRDIIDKHSELHSIGPSCSYILSLSMGRLKLKVYCHFNFFITILHTLSMQIIYVSPTPQI